MKYDPNAFETWRPNFELRQSMMWLTGFVGFGEAGRWFDVSGATMGCALCCAGMGLWKFKPAARRFAMTKRLAGTPLPFVDFKEFRKMLSDPIHADHMWLGRGFSWGPTQTQRLAELMKRDYDKTYREALGAFYFLEYLRKNLLFTMIHPWQSRHNYYELQKLVAQQIGYTWIHGVGDTDEDLYQSMDQTEGHTLIIGTTGSGKTRAFDMLISQAVLREETVFIIDPKGDHDLMEKAQRACQELGRGARFVVFHPAFPQKSIRINLLANWSRPSEIADRISSLMPAQSENDPFKSFAFGALNAVCYGLTSIYSKPTLKNLKHYLAGTGSGALAALVIDALEAFIRKTVPNGPLMIEQAIAQIEPKKRDPETIAAAMVMLYQSCGVMDSDMDGLIAMFTHNREHFSKMITSLLPVLSMLTSGELGKMLSPSDDDPDKDRETFLDTGKLIEKNQVVYVGLDSLSDPLVGSAIGALFLSDLACVAGARYNYLGTEPEVQEVTAEDMDLDEEGTNPEKEAHDDLVGKTPKLSQKPKKQRINIFVDEAAEVINGPAIQLLNKGRGAGFRCFIATQTYADFAARLGSKEKANQVVGNLNNFLCLRCVDPDTQKFIVNKIPKTKIRSIMRSQGLSTTSNAPVPNGGSLGERMTEEEVPLIPPEVLGMLPNLEFIGIVSGGHIIKGRYPLILKDKAEFKH